MKGYMYILTCADGSYYTGSTIDLERRLHQHQSGMGANFTKKHLPVELVYMEEFKRIDQAFYREKQVQGWSRKKKEALIRGEYQKLPELSKNYTQHGPPESTLPLRQAQGAGTTDAETPNSFAGSVETPFAEPVETPFVEPAEAPFVEPVETNATESTLPLRQAQGAGTTDAGTPNLFAGSVEAETNNKENRNG